MLKATATFLLSLMLVVATAPAAAQDGAITAPRNLQQLTARAGIIVRGTVTGSRVEKHPVYRGLDTVVVDLRVRDPLKGRVGTTYSFRQYVWLPRARHEGGGYRKGQDLLLFLIAPNANGLSSPAGQDQGRFHIRRDHDGRETAINGRGNLQLFDGVAEAAEKGGAVLSARSRGLLARKPAGPVDFGELISLVRELVAAGS